MIISKHQPHHQNISIEYVYLIDIGDVRVYGFFESVVTFIWISKEPASLKYIYIVGPEIN